jgi:plasmid stability protein
LVYRDDVPNLNVRNVPAEVIERLREQAALEGVSLSEWVRVALDDRGRIPTTKELVARRSERPADDAIREQFDEYYRQRLHRHRA